MEIHCYRKYFHKCQCDLLSRFKSYFLENTSHHWSIYTNENQNKTEKYSNIIAEMDMF